jgi:hypothetical protein
LEPPIAVVSVKERYALLEPTESGIERKLWYDQQHEVTVLRGAPTEIVLPDFTHEALADALILIKGVMTAKGLPTDKIDEITAGLHFFSSPSTEVEVVVRPKQA